VVKHISTKTKTLGLLV